MIKRMHEQWTRIQESYTWNRHVLSSSIQYAIPAKSKLISSFEVDNPIVLRFPYHPTLILSSPGWKCFEKLGSDPRTQRKLGNFSGEKKFLKKFVLVWRNRIAMRKYCNLSGRYLTPICTMQYVLNAENFQKNAF